LDCAALDEAVRVSDVPEFGMCIDSAEFVSQLTGAIKEFQPDLIAIDPFNHIVSDEKYKEFREAIRAVQSIVAQCGSQAAILFVHHLRKGRDGERPRGQRLLDHLAGSYAFGAAMRTVAVLQSASDNPEETRLVFTICKANNAEKPPASAWQRDGARWVADGNFDIAAFLHGDSDNVGNRKAVTEEHLAQLFQNGERRIARKKAVEDLMNLADVKHTAAYDALKTGSGRKFKALKEDRDGLLTWEPVEGGE
jgi:RecA-family ATPase